MTSCTVLFFIAGTAYCFHDFTYITYITLTLRLKIIVLTLFRYQINILLRGLKFTPASKLNIIQLKSDIHNYTRNLRLRNLQDVLKTKSNFLSSGNRDRGLDHQIGILNNLDLEGMDICYKNTLSKMEESALLKLINDRTIITKPADKEGAVVVLSTEHCKTMIMQHLDDVSTYKKIDLNMT